MDVAVRWKGCTYVVNMDPRSPMLLLKEELALVTGVDVPNQKILGIRKKVKDMDNMSIAELGLKPGKALMMMGERDKDIERIREAEAEGKAAAPSFVEDMEVEGYEGDEDGSSNPVYLQKVQRRIEDYEPHRISDPRPGKKLLVLDIDYTLFDHRSTAQHPLDLRRPHLIPFLEKAFSDYDIAIWSATNLSWIKLKMDELQVSTCTTFSLLAYFDYKAMITVQSQEFGVKDVKPLAVVWANYPMYGPHNTIMFDDIRRNFFMNPQNGLRIHAFRQAALSQDDDHLLRLSRYLELIAPLDSFSHLDHRRWKEYVKRPPS
eukprot:TRINITY_DN20858_c0_g1_i1.p1 TRINITY_DN20858_c0_g1~~TRINITY_DN20858_c0_g1_i1.p1  ORF type:complete len:366 (+),score=103.67 TRINITY_DN20858_c0_g1_i1:146-1099(+)